MTKVAVENFDELTLLQGKSHGLTEDISNYPLFGATQLDNCMHSQQCSRRGYRIGFIFKSIDQETKLTISNLFQPTGSSNQLKIKLINPKAEGSLQHPKWTDKCDILAPLLQQ